MTDLHDRQSLSNLQLLVLARLSCSKGANATEVADMLAEVAPPDGLQTAHDHARQALEVLQRRFLVTCPKSTKRTPNPRSHITEDGRRALCEVFSRLGKSAWTAVRDRVPALGLEVATNFDQSRKRSHIDNEVAVAVLRQRLGIPQASTVTSLCDALIARKLGLTGSITLLRLRAYCLVDGLEFDPTVSSTKELESLARRVADRFLDEMTNGTRSLRQVLGQRWAYRAIGSAEVVPGPLPRSVSMNQPRARLHMVPDHSSEQLASGRPVSIPHSIADSHVPGPIAIPADMLLTLVREALPRIGPDGRFGDEKVFVSAIWQHLEDDGRLADWSLDRFKRWLVKANSDQLLDLARADAQGDMDSRLVEESEIIDRGAAFHFVVDRQALTSRRGFHAR